MSSFANWSKWYPRKFKKVELLNEASILAELKPTNWSISQPGRTCTEENKRWEVIEQTKIGGIATAELMQVMRESILDEDLAMTGLLRVLSTWFIQLHYDQFYAAVQQRYLKYDSMLSSNSRIGWRSPSLSLPLYINTMLDEFQNVQEENYSN